ncbi:MAG TPA: hypothetical protein VMS98_04435 [Thermoanaerobaculia bacterium]|nr:hypothetical protein [Thermoanaerobaculia bacterium]
MKRQIAISLVILFGVTTLAFAHAGEVHSYMGTITTLQEDGSFMLEKTDGTTMHVHVTKTTTYLHADGHAAKPSDLKVGSRVVAKISKDGKTALSIKMSPKKQ